MNESFFFDQSSSVTYQEVTAYLAKYEALSIRTEKASNFLESGLFSTVHRYRNGLVIYLKWKTNTECVQEGFPNINYLFTLRNRCFFTPQGFEIVLPNQPFDYEILEHTTSSPLLYDNQTYIRLMEDIRNSLAFEEYYKHYKKDTSF